MQPLLEVKNLIVSFHSDTKFTDVVKGISFSIQQGETLGIVGESGSGKSITSLSIMKLLSNGGFIRFGEILFRKNNQITNLAALSENQIRPFRGKEIAMIFQEPMTSLNPVLTCGFQVQEAILVHQAISNREARERVIQLFEKVKLPRPKDIYNAYPHQLSGGQKQRVMIAMAISCNPALLIADEPTTALDVTVQKKILGLLRDIQQEQGMSMIFITHDLGVTVEIAHRVAVMHQGTIVEEGKTTDIFNQPKHPYTQGLIACRPPLNKRYYILPTVKNFLDGTADELLSEMNLFTAEKRKEHHQQIYCQKPLLQVKNLTKIYELRRGIFGRNKQSIVAVNNVSLDVYPGETIGLVGESGCGKTTLARCILRLIEPTQGEIIYRGKSITSMQGKELRKMRRYLQIIFQDPYSSLNPRMSIGEAIMEPMWVHRIWPDKKTCRDKTVELLEKVGLTADHFKRLPHEFSGGQRQRIVIARALSVNPEFIICDESVSALDVSVQAQVLNLLNQLKKDFGFTYIFISHDLSVVKFMSDRIFVMNQGKIEESGDPDEIYQNPQSEFTKRLIDSIPGRTLSV